MSLILKAGYLAHDRSMNMRKAAEICLRCGVCCVVRGHSCHVSYDVEKFNPKHTFVYNCLGAEDPVKNPNIWLCVSCHKCEEICPYEVSPISFIEEMKALAFQKGYAQPMIVGEVENVISTSYAFQILPSTARMRGELGLKALKTTAVVDVQKIAEKTALYTKLRKAKEARS